MLFRGRKTQGTSSTLGAAADVVGDPLRSLERTGDGRAAALKLSEELDAAIDQGLWDRALRLADAATRLWPTHRRLAEPLARLRLAQGDATTALMIIDSVTLKPASLRLLRAICLLHEGRRDEAHSELLSWTSRASASNAARRLRALLEWSVGEVNEARACLMQNINQLPEVDSIEQLVLLCVAEGRADEAGIWAAQMSGAFGAKIDAERRRAVLLSMGMRSEQSASVVDERRILQLATELLANEAVLPGLVEAQRISPNTSTIELLIGGVERALPEMRAARLGRECLRALLRLREELGVTPPKSIEDAASTENAQGVIAVIRTNDETAPARGRRKAA